MTRPGLTKRVSSDRNGRRITRWVREDPSTRVPPTTVGTTPPPPEAAEPRRPLAVSLTGAILGAREGAVLDPVPDSVRRRVANTLGEVRECGLDVVGSVTLTVAGRTGVRLEVEDGDGVRQAVVVSATGSLVVTRGDGGVGYPADHSELAEELTPRGYKTTGPEDPPRSGLVREAVALRARLTGRERHAAVSALLEVSSSRSSDAASLVLDEDPYASAPAYAEALAVLRALGSGASAIEAARAGRAVAEG